MAARKSVKSAKGKLVPIQIRFPQKVHQMLVEAAELEHLKINPLVVRLSDEAARKIILKHRQIPMFESTLAEPRNPRLNSQKGNQ